MAGESGAVTSGHDSLKDGFDQFVHVAKELESSYASLKQRAAQVDLELQQSNTLEQLPHIVVAIRPTSRIVGR